MRNNSGIVRGCVRSLRPTRTVVLHTVRRDLPLVKVRLARYLPAVLLLLAAGAKLFYSDASGNSAFLAAHTAADIALAGAELCLAGWLLSGWRNGASRLVAVAFFACLMGASVHSTAAGKSSCGCFGAVHVDPLLTSVFDLVAMACLLFGYRPARIAAVAATTRAAQLLSQAAVPLVLIGFAAFGYWFRATQDKGGWYGSLSINPRELEFGSVWVRNAYEHSISVKNNSDEPIQIAGFITSCGCTKVEPNNLVIPARGSRTVKATLDFRFLLGARPNGPAPFTVRLSPKVKDSAFAQPSWFLRGTVFVPLSCKMKRIDFPSPLSTEGPLPSRELFLTANYALSRVNAYCDRDLADVSVLSSREGGYVLTVTPKRTLPIGPFDFDVWIAVTLSDRRALPRFSIPVSGRVRDDVHFVPDELEMGAGSVGTSLTQQVSLVSDRMDPIHIERIDGAEGFMEPHQAGDAPCASLALTLHQPVAVKGRRQYTVMACVRSSSRGMLEIPLRVSYYGTSSLPLAAPVATDTRGDKTITGK